MTSSTFLILLRADQDLITFCSEAVQRYFNQGLRLFYGFDQTGAIRSFQGAAGIDPHCAMAYWGIALALGPTINTPLDPEREKLAHRAIEHARSLAGSVSKRERAYIEALTKRYLASPTTDRQARDRAYADAMRTVAQRFPDDLDAATLFAAALMQLHPWEYWTADGRPQPDTVEIITTLEKVLQKNPNHIGAIHYYLHALESSPYPERALRFAQRLPRLALDISHLLHMPSHIYLRTGRYAEAVDSNRQAVEKDEHCLHQPTQNQPCSATFYSHNLHALWAALTMDGRSAEALAVARRLAEQVPHESARVMPEMEPWAAMPLYTLVRFGRWTEILNTPQPPPEVPFVTAIWHYARGMAFIATGHLDQAEQEKMSLETVAATLPPERIAIERNTAIDLLRIASLVVTGEVTAKRKHLNKAVQSLQKAVHLQDQLRYAEPPSWYYPTRHSLGAILIEANQPVQAELVYREDLRRNPENGWTLYGLTQSLRGQKKKKEATITERRFHKAWARADVALSGSRFDKVVKR